MKEVAKLVETDDDYDWDISFPSVDMKGDLKTRLFDTFLDRACRNLLKKIDPLLTLNNKNEFRNNADSQVAQVSSWLDRASTGLTYESKSTFKNST